MPTIHDVAKEAAVSPSTVSRCFWEDTPVNPDTRKSVLDAASRLNYRPPRIRARAGRGERRREEMPTRTIGFEYLAPAPGDSVFTDAFYSQVLVGAEKEASAHGVKVVLASAMRNQAALDSNEFFGDTVVAGALLVGRSSRLFRSEFIRKNPFVVLVDDRDEQNAHDCVLSDGVGGALEGCRYLLSLGHRKIGFVMSDPDTATFQDRLTGFLGAMWRAGIDVDRDCVITVPAMDEFEERIHALLSLPEDRRPTALMTANDPHAYVVLQICHARGLRVPEDLSVLGFDSDRYSGLSCPALTTMQVDTEQLGIAAINRLLFRLEETQRLKNTKGSQNKEAPTEIVVPVKLVERQSCSAIGRRK